MPIEILEMAIKVNLTEDKAGASPPATGSAPEAQPIDKQTLTEDIFAQVIAYLDHKTDR